jgi:hypothetical protein
VTKARATQLLWVAVLVLAAGVGAFALRSKAVGLGVFILGGAILMLAQVILRRPS